MLHKELDFSQEPIPEFPVVMVLNFWQHFVFYTLSDKVKCCYRRASCYSATIPLIN